MSYIKYDQKDGVLYVLFIMKGYIEIQPKTYEECTQTIEYYKKVIDAIRLNFPEHRQIFIADLENSYISEMYSMRYTIRMLNEIHDYTKHERLLDKIIIRNTGNLIMKVYNTVKRVLPPFIDELLIIEPMKDTQKSDTDESEVSVLENLAKCIHDT